MRQVLFGGNDSPLDDTITEYNTLLSGSPWGITAAEADFRQIITSDGKIKWFRAKTSDRTGNPLSPGAGKKYTFTLYVNGAPTALTFEIADAATSGSNMVNEIAVSQGDTVSIECVPDGTPTEVYARWASVFEGDNANESLILGGRPYPVSNSWIRYAQVMGSLSENTITENYHREVCPTAGTIKDLFVNLSIDPGTAPDAYRITLRKNGINTTLTVTIIANATSGSDLIHSVAVVAGDVLTMMIEPLDTPSATPSVNWGMTFVANINGESIIIGGNRWGLHVEATEHVPLTSKENEVPQPSEYLRSLLGQRCVFKKLYILLSNPPGAGKSYTFTLRSGLADTDVVAIVADAATTGNSGTTSGVVELDDVASLKSDPDGTPDVVFHYWGLVCYIGPWLGKLYGLSSTTEIAKIYGTPIAEITKVMGVVG